MRSNPGFARAPKQGSSRLTLESGSRVAVIGGGPAGSLFSYFALNMAGSFGIEINLDIYESKDFLRQGPAGCNHCGGIISETLVQLLATEGINLPPAVVQRGIDSYVLHMDAGSVHIDTPLHEKRIAAVHRGAGPLGLCDVKWASFDGYLLDLAEEKGARLVRARVEDIGWMEGRPRLKAKGREPAVYDLLVVAVGVNSSTLKLFEDFGIGYRPPRTTKTFIGELCLGEEAIHNHLGSSMHVFLLNLPNLDFAALIPKGDYVTMCLLGRGIDKGLIDAFILSPEVRGSLPPGWRIPASYCRCSPALSIEGAKNPFADRIVFIGDCGVTRLYKDGMGAAFRTAKAAARTAVYHGISAGDFRRHFRPACARISFDNGIGKIVFAVTHFIQKVRILRRGLLRMVSMEQSSERSSKPMSMVLWDTFTGSVPYRDVFLRAIRPSFLARLFWNTLLGMTPFAAMPAKEKGPPSAGLGKLYRDGESIIREGDVGECMFVIQKGEVEILKERNGGEMHLGRLGEGDFFGEMALVDREVRSATARARGDVRVLTIDKRTFLSRVHEDPALAFRIVQKMSGRVRDLHSELIALKQSGEEKV
jgi:flavin-dependent dehydrogenase